MAGKRIFSLLLSLVLVFGLAYSCLAQSIRPLSATIITKFWSTPTTLVIILFGIRGLCIMNNSKFFGLFCTSAAILLLAGCTASKNEPSVSQSSTSTVASTSESSASSASSDSQNNSVSEQQTWSEKSPDGDYYIEVYEKDGHVYRVDDDTMLYWFLSIITPQHKRHAPPRLNLCSASGSACLICNFIG